jgi:predicted nucleotidyltransferase
MSTAIATEPQRVIVRAIKQAMGPMPVVLCGSRATGDADEGSDYDILVVAHTLRIPFLLRRMNLTASRLEQELGVPVSLNPLPRARLRRPGASLLPWKLRREGKVLSAPGGFSLKSGTSPEVTRAMRSSYAVSAVRYLIKEIHPEELGLESLPPRLQRGVRKALLHAIQLQLLHTGRYAARLNEGLSMIEPAEPAELNQLARTLDRPEAWFRVRDLLIEELDEGSRGMRTVSRNLQYAALSALRGRGFRFRALGERPSVSQRLQRTAILLAGSIGVGGAVDRVQVSAAAATLPGFLRPTEVDWTTLRDVVEREWPEANPLLGL